MSDVSFSERLKFLKLYKGVLCSDIAKAINTTPSAVSNYLNGKREPDMQTIKNLAEYFHCSIDYLLGSSSDELHCPLCGSKLKGDKGNK